MQHQRYTRFGFLVVVLILLLSRSGWAEEELTKAEIQEMYSTYLADEGYRPHVDSDGDVVFKHESKTYFVAVREDDLEYFTVVLPNFWEIESERERLQVLIAADAANAKSKVSKIYIIKDNTWAAVELFLNKPENFEKVFPRSLRAIDNAVNNFIEKMKELREDTVE